MTFYDPQTKFPLGDPENIPLSGSLPQKKDFDASLSEMILSASGWRKVFAVSGKEEDNTPVIGSVHEAVSALIAEAFADYLAQKTGKAKPSVVLGIDARPTGTVIADIMLRVLCAHGFSIRYLFITAAPEIMAYSRSCADGFIYISASHNPIGHNGVKFGLCDGGVIPGSEASVLIADFKKKCTETDAIEHAAALIASCPAEKLVQVYTECPEYKKQAVQTYQAFTREVVAGSSEKAEQDALFNAIRKTAADRPLSIVCDMNGSARALSIDKHFLEAAGIGFYAINDTPRKIVHAIIPEPENLVYCAEEMTKLRKTHTEVSLGYMPDCDGDRGNIVYWDDRAQKAEVLKAQEVFALSVMGELACLAYQGKIKPEGRGLFSGKTAVAVNDPTSMRIEEIASAFGARTARAEVGEANVVNLARKLRTEGYQVRILGEGSNGGNITHPAAVRDPLNTIFALIKLLVLRDSGERRGLFHLWCTFSGQEDKYREAYTLADIIATLPVYITTGVSDERALLHITETDHSALKGRYQKVFLSQWEEKKAHLKSAWGIEDWEAVANNGINETRNLKDFSLSAKGGLKILFKNSTGAPLAYIWMRGSGTEPVFRVLCDVKGSRPAMEAELLDWHTKMIQKADKAI